MILLNKEMEQLLFHFFLLNFIDWVDQNLVLLLETCDFFKNKKIKHKMKTLEEAQMEKNVVKNTLKRYFCLLGTLIIALESIALLFLVI